MLVVGRTGGEPIEGNTVRRGYAVRTANVDDLVLSRVCETCVKES